MSNTAGGHVVANHVGVLVVIDTWALPSDPLDPSQDPNNPTLLGPDAVFTICDARPANLAPASTAQLVIASRLHDRVSVCGCSAQRNADDAAIVYRVHHGIQNHVLSRPEMKFTHLSHAAMPDPTTHNGLPAITAPVSFSRHDMHVLGAGIEDVEMDLALYRTNENGDAQDLYGYFRVKVTIIVTVIDRALDVH